MATYAEYLKSCGASEEEIKILDTPTARKAYERMEEGVVRLARERDEAKAGATAYESRANAWFEENDKKLKEAQARVVAVESDASRFRTALLAAHKQGLIDVAKDLGFKEEELQGGNPNPPVRQDNPPVNGFDPKKYFTADEILQIAAKEGDAIAIAQDIAAEHVYLFGSPLRDFRKLREEAQQRKISVEALWMEKYKVPEARTAKETKAREDHDNEVRVAERKKVEEEFAAKYSANPDLRVPVESTSPWTARPAGNVRSGKQPWEIGSDELTRARVEKGTQTVLKTDFSKIPAARVM